MRESELPLTSKVKVEAARKVWGTLHECTTKSVKNVIARVCKIEKGVYVKRKVSENSATKKFKW